MGLCRFCGTKAGFFKEVHEACQQRADSSLSDLRELVADAVRTGRKPEYIEGQISELRERGRLNGMDISRDLLRSADSAAMTLAHDHPVSDEDLERIGELFKVFEPEFFERGGDYFKRWHGYVSLSFSNTLYQVLHGIVPYFPPDGQTSFRLSRDETIIVKRGAGLAEYRTVSSGGGYQSVSLPVGGGVYYRLGASLPKTESTGLVLVDQGSMLVTTHAVYFGGAKASFRIPYDSILRLESFADGIGIYENHGTGKVLLPYSLGFDDGWFFYNLISALSDQVRN